VAGLPARPQPRAAHPDAVLAANGQSAAWRIVSLGVTTVLPTAATLALYAALRTWWPALVAKVIAVGLTARLAAWAGAGRPQPPAAWAWVGRPQPPAALALGLRYLLTSGALVLLDAVVRRPTRPLELAALLAASVAGAVGQHALATVLGSRRPRPDGWEPVIVRPAAEPDAGTVPAFDAREELSA